MSRLPLFPVAAACLGLLASACVDLPPNRAIPRPAAPPQYSNTVRCNCVVNSRRDDKACTNPSLCPGPKCPCPGMDFDMCLPPDLNHDTATDPTVRARLTDPAFDFNAAVQTFCRERGGAIMIDIGAVSQHAIICEAKDNMYFEVNLPALVNCQAVSYDGTADKPSTYQTLSCGFPCTDVLCVNGPKGDHPDANCDGDDVFTRTALHPEACRCNRVAAWSSCRGRDSERFCVPPRPEVPAPIGARAPDAPREYE